MSLPPLPEHDGTLEDNTCELRAYTTATLLAYGRACRAAALEEAAKAVYDAGGDNTDYHMEALRALKEKKE